MDSSSSNMESGKSEPLLLHTPPPPPPPQPLTSRKRKAIILSLLITFILISGSIILSLIYKNNKKPEELSVYHFHSKLYYCHLTRYHNLCYDSMSSIINTTSLQSRPDLIFSGSIRVAVSQLNNSMISITKALSSTKNGAVSESRLRECEKRVSGALSRLNESLSTIFFDSDVTYLDVDEMKALELTARSDAFRCFRAMEEIGDLVEGEERLGVEEVKLGVERARKCIVNSIELLDGRDSIFEEFYNPSGVVVEAVGYFDNNYNYYYDYGFLYWDLVCVYSVMYFFIALLYFVFWRTV